MPLNKLEQEAFGKALAEEQLAEDLELTEENLLGVGMRVVMELGRMIQRARSNPESVTISIKADGTRQTNLDIEAQNRAQEIIEIAFPGHKFIGEESTGEKLIDPASCTWLIDPIDSTNTFLSHENICAVCLSLVKEGKAIFSIVMNPFTGEIFYTYDDQNSRLVRLYHTTPPSADDLPLKALGGEENLRFVHVQPRPINAYLYDRIRRAVQPEEEGDVVDKLVQIGGSPAYSMAAAGKGFYTYLNTWPRNTDPWEIVPGAHLITNTRGGVLTSEKGDIINPFSHIGVVVASARRELHDLVLQLINQND